MSLEGGPALPRRESRASHLLRLGFVDPANAATVLDDLGGYAEELLPLLSLTADPDLALRTLGRLAEVVGGPSLDDLVEDEGTAMRLLAVLGASEALGDHLVRHPEQWLVLADPTLGSSRPTRAHIREQLVDAVGQPDGNSVEALRIEYRRALVSLVARDLAHDLPVEDVAAELSDLAAGVLEAALIIARTRVGEAADGVRFAVIAMGKCGGHELNYVSDVDVIFVHEPVDGVAADEASRAATRLATELMEVCSAPTAEGMIWQVDPALRPEGKAGPLSRTLDSHVGYYERWASTWEFQALLKARPIAGDRALGEQYVEAVTPFIWRAAEREGFVTDTQAMRRRVVANIPQHDADREIKLGIGGLRDVEFAVQLLQLVHGRTDLSVRKPDTLSALRALTDGGYVGRDDGEALSRAYAFLRQLEHRIQLSHLRRTHLMPTADADRRRLGRTFGYFKHPIERLEETWTGWRREIRRLHEKLFYRPLLAAVARIPSDEARLTTQAAQSRLEALGYADPASAMRHIEALTDGVSRRAALQRALLPALMEWFAQGSDPDGGLAAFRRLSERLGETPWYLRALRDEGEVAERLARILSTSRYASELLEREPLGIGLLGDSLTPRTAHELEIEMQAAVERRGGESDPAIAVRAVRSVRRRELLRLSARETLRIGSVEEIATGLTRLTDATLKATLAAVTDATMREHDLTVAPASIAVIAMGRYGGAELSYGSDADVLFVTQAQGGASDFEASEFAQTVVRTMRDLLSMPGPDPAVVLDAGLRPEGRNGAFIRSLAAYAAYYDRWSEVWEAQALLRADSVAGDADLSGKFMALIDSIRYPQGGLTEDEVREIRRIKGRVDAERLPRGADANAHLKLGRGGLADIEWTVQLLQLRHAWEIPELRTPQTIAALDAASTAGLLEWSEADRLKRAWQQISRMRNAITLAAGRPSDILPRAPRERRAVATIMGYADGGTEEMVNDHLRLMRQAWGVVDTVFWGS